MHRHIVCLFYSLVECSHIGDCRRLVDRKFEVCEHHRFEIVIRILIRQSTQELRGVATSLFDYFLPPLRGHRRRQYVLATIVLVSFLLLHRRIFRFHLDYAIVSRLAHLFYHHLEVLIRRRAECRGYHKRINLGMHFIRRRLNQTSTRVNTNTATTNARIV